MKRKLTALLLAAALALALSAPAAAAEDARIDTASALLADGAELTQNTYWTGGDYRTETYAAVAPGALRPVVVSRETLCSAGSLAAAAARLEEQTGLRTLAGVNGGFYNTADLSPVGAVVSGGALRSDDDGLYAVGFRGDGSAVIGKPQVKLSVAQDGEAFFRLAALNHTGREGVSLFTADYGSAVRLSGTGWYAVCAIDGEIPLSGERTLTVTETGTYEGRLPLPESGIVLTLPGETDSDAPAPFSALEPGLELTLTAECAEGWENVESAVCLLYKLVTDGKAESGLERSAAPRTAVGLRADGTLIVYTVDGRQSGYSVGSGLDRVAARLIALGCVEAGALDGGGSTVFSAVLPGDTALTRQSSPSGGSERAVVNHLLLATDAEPTGSAARLALYPLDIDALAGAEVPLTVKAADENGFAAPVPENVTFSVTTGLGEVRDGVYYAAGSGEGTITVSAPGLRSVSIPVSVAAEPDEWALYGEKYGKKTESLTLEPGQEVDLTVRAWKNHLRLEAADTAFTWALDEAAGTVDETGHLIPAENSGEGFLTVSVGEQSLSIPIRIRAELPFYDVKKADRHYAAVKYVYENNIFLGTSDTAFSPEVVMDRAMLVTVLWRLSGEPEAASPAAFADVAEDAWYAAAVAWAGEAGLVQGYSAERFAPADPLTREQILTILWRWAGSPEPDADASLAVFPDAADAGSWAESALRWAVSEKMRLTDPDESGALLPKEHMTRAAVAEVLMRYLTANAE